MAAKPELSNTHVYPDYWLAVFTNGDVVKLSSENQLPGNDVRLLIRCEHLNSYYYKNIVHNSKGEQMPDNIFIWDSYKCQLKEKEYWEDIRTINVVLEAKIWDRFGTEKVLKYENAAHNGNGFQELFNYLYHLELFQTHTALEIALKKINERDERIEKLVKEIKELKAEKP